MYIHFTYDLMLHNTSATRTSVWYVQLQSNTLVHFTDHSNRDLLRS